NVEVFRNQTKNFGSVAPWRGFDSLPTRRSAVVERGAGSALRKLGAILLRFRLPFARTRARPCSLTARSSSCDVLAVRARGLIRRARGFDSHRRICLKAIARGNAPSP